MDIVILAELCRCSADGEAGTRHRGGCSKV